MTESNYDSDQFNPRGGLLQSAGIPENGGKPQNRAMKDIGMARDVIRTMQQANRHRHIINSRIMAKYNAERPYVQSSLENEGLGWRSNFTTKPLAQIIERVYPRYVSAINGMKYLTNSSLSNKWQNSVEKTEAFREGVTSLFRNRKGWRTLLEDISLCNTMFGFEVVSWLDNFSYFPKAHRQEEIFLSEGTKQSVDTAQIVVLKENYLPHELYDAIRDRESAAAAGWNIDNTAKVINEASPQQLRDLLGNGYTQELWYQNAQRELTTGSSYMAAVSIVAVYNMLAQEPGGKVSHYRVAGAGLDEIFTSEDRFDSMEDAIAFYSFQKGNGTMHGSKGVGREVYELAAMQDRIRNETVDRTIMSGKLVVQGNIRQLHKFKMSVLGATVIVPEGWNFLEQRIDGAVEPFLQLDSYFKALVDEQVGNVSPPTAAGVSGEAMRSPAAWNLLASREEENKDTRIERFLGFFVSMIGTMQRRACNKETTEQDAKDFQKRMLEIMSQEELDELAKCPVSETVRDLTPMQRQLTVALASEKRGNPLYNQRQLEVEDLNARMGPEFAKRVLLPEEDPTEQAEQSRLQAMELLLLTQGTPVPVSTRDNHQIHLGLLMPMAEQMAGAVMQGQAGTASFEAIVAHISEHYQRAIERGAPPDMMKPVGDFLKQAMPVIAKLHEMDAKAEQLHAAAQMHEAGAHPEDVAAAATGAQVDTGAAAE